MSCGRSTRTSRDRLQHGRLFGITYSLEKKFLKIVIPAFEGISTPQPEIHVSVGMQALVSCCHAGRLISRRSRIALPSLKRAFVSVGSLARS